MDASLPVETEKENPLEALDEVIAEFKVNRAKRAVAAQTLEAAKTKSDADKVAAQSAVKAIDKAQHDRLVRINELLKAAGPLLDERAASCVGVLAPAWWKDPEPCPQHRWIRGESPSSFVEGPLSFVPSRPSNLFGDPGGFRLPYGGDISCFGDGPPRRGASTSFYLNGYKNEERFYVDGRKEKAIVRWHDNGKLAEHTEMQRDKRHGPSRTLRRDGSRELEGTYKRDRMHGTWTYYGENNQELGSFEMKNGSGTMREWHDNGKLKSESRVRRGKVIKRVTYDASGKEIRNSP